jgi:glycosyltransferase involved in cell wall biosynthesis
MNAMNGPTANAAAGELRPVELGLLPASPVLSVLLCNYNYARYIGEAIESVLEQSYKSFELIVCDDGSTDGSCEVVERYRGRDPRLRLVRKENGGQASAFNLAYRQSRGEIVCFLDSDDRYLPEKLQAVVEAFQGNPQGGFLMHRQHVIDQAGRRLGSQPLMGSLPSGWWGPRTLENAGRVPVCAACSGLCLRREIADQVFPLPENFKGCYGDGLLIALPPLLTPIVSIDRPLSEYRQHGGNLSANAPSTQSLLERNLAVFRGIWDAQKEYLDRLDPEVGAALAPIETHTSFLVHAYALARLRRDGSGGEAYRRLVRDRNFVLLPWTLRCFWRCSAGLPDGLFARAAGFVWGQNALKRLLSLLLIRIRSWK